MRQTAACPSTLAHMLDQSHNVTDPIESLMASAIELQRAYAQALLVDREQLAELQEKNDALGAAQALKRAFTTDVDADPCQARHIARRGDRSNLRLPPLRLSPGDGRAADATPGAAQRHCLVATERRTWRRWAPLRAPSRSPFVGIIEIERNRLNIKQGGIEVEDMPHIPMLLRRSRPSRLGVAKAA